MKIEEIEYTPNPNAVKFIVDQQLTSGVGGVTKDFQSEVEAEDVPLARDIFAIENVVSVFFAANYITVTQNGEAEWRELMREVAEPIREAELEDTRSESQGGQGAGDEDSDKPDVDLGFDDPRMENIEEVIDAEIRPYLEGDGGGLEIKGLVEDELLIAYQGACGTCPASVTGTLMSIEHLIKQRVDEGISVVSI